MYNKTTIRRAPSLRNPSCSKLDFSPPSLAIAVAVPAALPDSTVDPEFIMHAPRSRPAASCLAKTAAPQAAPSRAPSKPILEAQNIVGRGNLVDQSTWSRSALLRHRWDTLHVPLSWSLLRLWSIVSRRFLFANHPVPVPALARAASLVGDDQHAEETYRVRQRCLLLRLDFSHLSPACKSQNHHRVQVQHASIVLPGLESRTYTSMINKPSAPVVSCNIRSIKYMADIILTSPLHRNPSFSVHS